MIIYTIPSPVSGEGFFMRAVLFANGSYSQPEVIKSLLQPGDILIAADGGAAQIQTLHLLPEAVIGDFDSLSSNEVEKLEKAGVKILRFPEKKDFTDLELALQYAQSRGAKDILLLGALGNRWDQTLANQMLPAAAAFSGLSIWLVDGNQEMTLVRSGQTLELTGRPGDILSLIPLAGDANGITTQGLEYPLKEENIQFGSTRGISNVFLGESASVKLEAGMLLCVRIRASR
jgi:thiamine pyrophosphokinase